MAEQKIFAGPRIRRIRKDRGLSQTAMAQGLGISPSYLNLIERNQRPLTVQLILKLASVYKVDAETLQAGGGLPIAALREVFADPLLAGELPGDGELVDLAEGAPNAAAGMVKLYRAYREQAERLSDLNDLLAGKGEATGLSSARLPIDELRDVFEQGPNHFAALEEEAESFTQLLDGRDDLGAALKGWLKAEHGISVRQLPVAAMPNWRRRYDRHSHRLFISERLSPFDQLREIAMEAVLLRMRAVIDAELHKLGLSSDEARRLARFEFARYGAHALMMPYQAFLSAAERGGYDVDVLRSRFGVSFEQAANRLTSLQRTGASGVPFFMMEIDSAGHRLRRAGAEGFPAVQFGGLCPKLPVHAAFSFPGQIIVEAVEMPDERAFLTIARTLEGPQGAFNERPRQTALLLGCDMTHADRLVYGRFLPMARAEKGRAEPVLTAVGRSCRLCERPGCLARAEPPITRPLGLDEMVTGLSAFDFQ